MNEAAVSTKLRIALVKVGAKAMKVSDRFHGGRPDLFACYLGRFIVIETKMYPKKPTTLQAHELNDFIEHKANSFTATYNIPLKELVLVNLESGDVARFTNFGEAALWLLSQPHYCDIKPSA